MSSSGLLSSFVSALQASLSVLLVISYGVFAAYLDLLDQPTSKRISGVCVRFFLPALLITRVGSQLELENVLQYVTILVWSIVYNTTSLIIGLISCKLFHLPSWIVPAVTFNNTTSLPLLLVESLKMTGILERLLLDGDSSAAALTRAQSFFLVNSVVGNYLTFAIGPRLIGIEDKRRRPVWNDTTTAAEPDEETPLFVSHVPCGSGGGGGGGVLAYGVNTDPADTKQQQQVRHHSPYTRLWHQLDWQIQKLKYWVAGVVNPPLVGAIIGAVVGLVPGLHRAFFADTDEGGIFTAWLTQSLRNVGQLFVSLQVVVVGVSLYSAIRRMSRGENSGAMSWSSILFVFSIRFIVWPVVSVIVIYHCAAAFLGSNSHTKDPILWFAMMLMPTGPPAIKLVALADVSGADETVKMILSKLLVISYALSPVLAFTVVAALNMSEAATTAGG